MHIVLLTVLAISGANTSDHLLRNMQGDAPAACSSCETGACGHGHAGHGTHAKNGTCWGGMPQSCYEPAFGCYPGTRYMNRYPAFHQTFYRNPYNYRNYFDYPWHAEIHEPTSQFSFHTQGAPAGGNDGQMMPMPTPAPSAAASHPLHQDLRAAMYSGQTTGSSAARTYRR